MGMTAIADVLAPRVQEGRDKQRIFALPPEPRRCIYPHEAPTTRNDGCGQPVEATELEFGGWYMPFWCATCLEVAGEKETGERDRRWHNDNLASRYRAAGLLASDLTLPLAWLDTRVLPSDTAPWRYLHGPTGTGKTTQLVLAVRNAVDRRLTAKVTSELDLVESLSYRNGGKPADWWRYDVLAIDEFGEVTEEWQRNALHQVLDRRYRDGKATLFSSNRRVRELAAHGNYGARTADRILERCNAMGPEATGEGMLHLTYSHRAGRELGGAQ